MKKFTVTIFVLCVSTTLLLTLGDKTKITIVDSEEKSWIMSQEPVIASSKATSETHSHSTLTKQYFDKDIEALYVVDDLLDYVSKILEKRPLDEQSIYFAYKALDFCKPEKVNYSSFIDGTTPGELNELLVWAESRCAGFNAQNFSYYKKQLGSDPLLQSAKKGYPLAILELVKQDRIKALDKNLSKKELIRRVLESKDAYALRHLGWVDSSRNPRVWTLVSCKLGAKCSPLTFEEKVAAVYFCHAESRKGGSCSPDSVYQALLDDENMTKQADQLYRQVMDGADNIIPNLSEK